MGTIDIFDGSKVSSLASPVNSTSGADVHVPLPSGWTGTPLGPQNLVRDVNGDGYADFAVATSSGRSPAAWRCSGDIARCLKQPDAQKTGCHFAEDD